MSEQENLVKPPEEAQLKQRRPPHTCTPLWIDKFFAAARVLNTSQITREFITANVIGSGHQGKVLIALEFLGLIDENGKVTNRMRALRTVGDEFTSNLASVVQEAYSELLSTVAVKSASWDGLLNFLMQRYLMSQPQAEAAAKFFAHLASEAKLELGPELNKAAIPKGSTVSTERILKRPSSSPKPETKGSTSRHTMEKEAFATVESALGRIVIVDEPTLTLARHLLDILEAKIKETRKTPV